MDPRDQTHVCSGSKVVPVGRFFGHVYLCDSVYIKIYIHNCIKVGDILYFAYISASFLLFKN